MNINDEFLEKQTKEQIIIFLHNTEYELESLRKRMEKLTGCREFGAVDGMNGNCVECFYDNKKLLDNIKERNRRLEYIKANFL